MRNLSKLLVILAVGCAIQFGFDNSTAEAGKRHYNKRHYVARHHKAVVHHARPPVHVVVPGVRVHVGPSIRVHAYPGVLIDVAPRYHGLYYGW